MTNTCWKFNQYSIVQVHDETYNIVILKQSTCTGADPGGVGGARPPFHRQNICKKRERWDKKKICTKLQENASKISKVPRGHALIRPRGAHTCDERTGSLSPTPHAPPPFQNPGSAPGVHNIIMCLNKFNTKQKLHLV